MSTPVLTRRAVERARARAERRVSLGRRVSTTTQEGRTRHVYDNNWQVIADVDENDNVLVSYTWGTGIDTLLAVTIGGATYYPITDIQGSVWGYVDSQNNVVARWQYDAWGNVIDESVSVPVLASIRYRFQGREWSAATGLFNFRMRWYDPVTGRWLSKDPIGLSGGLNLYAFCGNSPVVCVDAFGLSWWNTVKQFASDFANGYVCGDFVDEPNLATSIGASAAGCTPVWGQISDARDTVANIISSVWRNPCDLDAWKDLCMCGIGWIPLLVTPQRQGENLLERLESRLMQCMMQSDYLHERLKNSKRQASIHTHLSLIRNMTF